MKVHPREGGGGSVAFGSSLKVVQPITNLHTVSVWTNARQVCELAEGDHFFIEEVMHSCNAMHS